MKYEYNEFIPKICSMVKLNKTGYFWLGQYDRFVDPGDLNVVGEVKAIVDRSTKHSCRELECIVTWNNGTTGQYPMSFLDEAKK